MNMIKQLGIGAIAGFVIAILFMLFKDFSFTIPIAFVINSLYVLIVMLWCYCLFAGQKIKRLSKKELEGEAEDEADDIISKTFYNYSFCGNSSMIIAVLALSLSMIESSILMTGIGIIAIIIGYIMTAYMLHVIKGAYPERNLPGMADKDFSKKMLEISDAGEKHIMLHALYKAYGFANTAFIIAIIAIALYSIFTGDAQLFSIVLISVILIIMNGIYLLEAKNK